MPSIYRRLGSIKVAVLDMCDYYDLGQIITRINVPQGFRGRGTGSALLREAIKASIEGEFDLWLEVSPSDGLDYKQLCSWYERYGFIGVGLMCRRHTKPLKEPEK